MRLKDKIILVTGGSGLLGKKIVEKIREEGGNCIAADINSENDLKAGNLKMDITNEIDVKQGIQSIYNYFGQLDGMVNAAYPRTGDWGKKFEEIEIESWRRNIDMQLNSVFILCREVLEKMKTSKKGVIVNLASIYGVVGPDFDVYKGTNLTMPAAYSAIKGGMINFTKYLASYYGAHNLRINCLSPGGIFDNQNPEFVKNYEQKAPLKRMGSAEDIAGPTVFLLSDEASYITGHNLIVDGGWTII
jgi:NAD(P)-dependent dehydrogenase (short-subunit alcohol dehydrogenase family)